MGLPCLLDPTVLLERSRAAAWASWLLAAFWAARLYCQWFVYRRDLWRGIRFETATHWLFTGIWMALNTPPPFVLPARKASWDEVHRVLASRVSRSLDRWGVDLPRSVEQGAGADPAARRDRGPGPRRYRGRTRDARHWTGRNRSGDLGVQHSTPPVRPWDPKIHLSCRLQRRKLCKM